jgi:hypothetical protein
MYIHDNIISVNDLHLHEIYVSYVRLLTLTHTTLVKTKVQVLMIWTWINIFCWNYHQNWIVKLVFG